MAAATRIGIPYYPRHSELEVMKEEEVDMIIEEVKDQLAELMTNQSRSYTIQRLFESCNQTQMSKILSFIATRQKLLDICFEEHGSRAVQKMIKHLEEPEQKRLLVSVLKPITLQLSKENGGHAYHVILQCMEQFLPEETECMPYTTLQIRERIVAVIMANALPLSDHPFGNYVVQYVVKMRIPYANANIIAKLRGHFVSLCMNKYASNVVEKCIDPNDVGDENSRRVMTEIFETSDFIRVLQDPYGNYVMQAALNVCKAFEE
ncbi:pumilio homolog 12-like [Carica papaya]|uniref:pumilio homolog 12-like n=1 Tax=Carica papaya TaxID=3649 RepID=UPI000B8CC7F9|nr:pumilio homolog 12-like [Carica papaya]